MAKEIKVNLAAEFLQLNVVKKEYLYVDIKKHIKELKNCYVDIDLIYYFYHEDHELVWMFLVDGCAILRFMYIFVNFRADRESQFRNLGIKFDYTFFLVHDLFSLENQLPYHLLQFIIRRAKCIKQHTKEDEFCSTSKEDELLKSIYKFIFYRFRTPEEWNENKKGDFERS
ncbi:hypothetical protein QYF36_015379 [Acer negundo]|nr:hypothetical protein QYF36_026692 [Acer negundo]KAK4846283.1 hypothetical protein QYF36_015379 [Acer negundo]